MVVPLLGRNHAASYKEKLRYYPEAWGKSYSLLNFGKNHAKL